MASASASARASAAARFAWLAVCIIIASGETTNEGTAAEAEEAAEQVAAGTARQRGARMEARGSGLPGMAAAGGGVGGGVLREARAASALDGLPRAAFALDGRVRMPEAEADVLHAEAAAAWAAVTQVAAELLRVGCAPMQTAPALLGRAGRCGLLACEAATIPESVSAAPAGCAARTGALPGRARRTAADCCSSCHGDCEDFGLNSGGGRVGVSVMVRRCGAEAGRVSRVTMPPPAASCPLSSAELEYCCAAAVWVTTPVDQPHDWCFGSMNDIEAADQGRAAGLAAFAAATGNAGS